MPNKLPTLTHRRMYITTALAKLCNIESYINNIHFFIYYWYQWHCTFYCAFDLSMKMTVIYTILRKVFLKCVLVHLYRQKYWQNVKFFLSSSLVDKINSISRFNNLVYMKYNNRLYFNRRLSIFCYFLFSIHGSTPCY